MRKFIISILTGLLLQACTSENNTLIECRESVNAIGQTITYNITEPCNLSMLLSSVIYVIPDNSQIKNITVTGDSNTINIGKNNNILDFRLTGNSNLIQFDSESSVENFRIVGASNSIITTLDSDITFTDNNSILGVNELIRQ